jgi:hypothetical protein
MPIYLAVHSQAATRRSSCTCRSAVPAHPHKDTVPAKQTNTSSPIDHEFERCQPNHQGSRVPRWLKVPPAGSSRERNCASRWFRASTSPSNDMPIIYYCMERAGSCCIPGKEPVHALHQCLLTAQVLAMHGRCSCSFRLAPQVQYLPPSETLR